MGTTCFTRVTLLLVASCALMATPAKALAGSRHVLLVALPYEEARNFIDTHPAAIGLGVYPESRDPIRFLMELGFGTPSAADISTTDTQLPKLADVLARGGVTVTFASQSDRAVRLETIESALFQAFATTRSTAHAGGRAGRLTVTVVARADELNTSSADILFLGIGSRTPVIAGVCPASCRSGSASAALLKGGVTRRPGLITPYDVGATILTLTGAARPSDFIGKPLVAEPRANASRYIDGLERRLVRDASAGSTPAVVTDAITVVVLLFGVMLVFAGRPGIAARGAQGGWMAVAVGYPVSRFLSTGNGAVRAIPVAVAFVFGAALSHRRSTGTARLFLGLAVAAALMFAIAPLNPGGEPGLSIWGNPLTSWRFFGMQNAWAATIAGGVVVWGVLAGLGTRMLVVVATLVAVVMGTPTLGANFVGVLTFAFGAALAALALARRRVELVHVIIAGATAVLAFLLALLADVGSPVSHGGRAAKRISDGGITTAWDFVTGRIQLNIDLIRGFWGGVLWVVLFIITLLFLARWGAKSSECPSQARTAVWAGSMMALASFVLEDSGFYSGTTLLGAALAGWIVTQATISSAATEPSGGG